MIATAPDRQLLFDKGGKNALAYGAYAVSNQTELDRLKRRIEAAGERWTAFTSPLLESGALAVTDPDGNLWVFGCARSANGPAQAQAVPAARLQHVVMASCDAQRITTFFENVLGFTLSDLVLDDDGTVRTAFLRCSHEHHSFAVFQAAENRLDHHCYEVADWNAIRDWGDHLAAAEIPLVWGPGRHGPGNNLFLFFHDADGNWVELSAELETVAHERPVATWRHEKRTLNTWGDALLRS